MFVTTAEVNTHIYDEVVEVISRDVESILETAIKAAISEAKGYMSRYDIITLLALTGDDRDPALVMYIKDIACWHFMVLANPNIDLDLRERRYKAATDWLKNIQAGKVVPYGWPSKPVDTETGNDPSSLFKYGSNPKRNNHY